MPQTTTTTSATPSSRTTTTSNATSVTPTRTTTSPTRPPGKLTLYTNHLTPNGLKVSIYLEELKAKDPTAFDYVINRVDLSTGEHKRPAFIRMNPNGRIPVLVDHTEDDFAVFESAAILLYLEQNYDKKKAFSFDVEKNPKEYSSIIQWIFFAHGGLGPMQGQGRLVYTNQSNNQPNDVEFQISPLLPSLLPRGSSLRSEQYVYNGCASKIFFKPKLGYKEETKRLYNVLEIGLKDRDWLVGTGRGRYTIADINAFPWVSLYKRAGIDNLEQWPSLKAWLARLSEQAGVKAAIKSVALS
ncbi:hypothetical protein H0H93_005411 [Arthromyces matolae]|nr:hypothetical protein H0H93_005411 [Arthromyces matolae]